MEPTKQQKAVVRRQVRPGEILLVNAYAGSGKTTTLELVAQARPRDRFLYLCFNRDNAEKARRSFPKNCECRTVHSLAWRSVGRHHAKIGQLRPRTVMELFDLSAPHLAVYAINTLNAYLHSEDGELGSRHLDVPMRTPAPIRNLILRVAGKIWDRMRDPKDEELPISHDGYLKLWALEEPVIEDYDVLLLDEAQDTNPVTLKLLLDQVERGSAGLILVGDTHQAIYAWRHAINAMESVCQRADFRLPLSESFRFVPGIAADADLVLNRLKNDPVKLVGRGSPDRKASDYAVLARANASLIEAAIEKARTGMPIHFAATKGEDSWDPWIPYKFQITLDTYHLWRGRPGAVKDPYMKKFRSFEEIEEHARGEGEEGNGRDVELGLQTQLVKKHGDDIPSLLELLQRRSEGPDKARLTFSTAHRAKGLEWDCVRLLDDFIDPTDRNLLDNLDRRERDEEFNILYVAITRARLKLKYPAKLLAWIQEHSRMAGEASHRFPADDVSEAEEPPSMEAPRERREAAEGPESRGGTKTGKRRQASKARKSTGTRGSRSPSRDLSAISKRVDALPLKKETASLHPNLQDARRQHPRAFEPWSDEEDELLRQAWALTQGAAQLARVFGRNIGGITSRAERLGLE